MKTVPYTYGRGTRLSSAYTIGRDGLPCPPYLSVKSSLGYQAWRTGHKQFIAATIAAHEAKEKEKS